jgi:hypothetical protein
MRKIVYAVILTAICFLLPTPVLAQTISPEVTAFTTEALSIITLISAVAAVFFLIRGGYIYITSTGKPDALEDAKKTIRNAIIGMVIILAANVIVSAFTGALTGSSDSTALSNLSITQVETVKPGSGLTQVLIDAINGFLQNVVESATKPVIDGTLQFLTTTPQLLNNATITKFWFIMLGITDSLFVLFVALLGLQFMSASTFGFEEIEFKHLLPRIGLAFLGANSSLFLADFIVKAGNALVTGVLSTTGGLNQAWITNAITITNLTNGTAPLIILIFLLIFLIVSVVLLFVYITRLIVICLGAVLSPFIFLLWVFPKTSDLAEMGIKSYFVTVFMVFIHVVTIQLAGAFLTLPQQNGNSLIAIAVAIGLLLTLLKTPTFMMQLVLFSSRAGSIKKMGGQIVNVISSKLTNGSGNIAKYADPVKTPRKIANL